MRLVKGETLTRYLGTRPGDQDKIELLDVLQRIAERSRTPTTGSSSTAT